MTTTRELYMIVERDGDGDVVNKYQYLDEHNAKTLMDSLQRATQHERYYEVKPQDRMTRSQVYVELGRNGLPSPLEISFDDRYPDFLRVRVTSVDDFDAWVEAYAVRVQSRGVRHVDTIQCSGFGEWRGWDLHLSMCVRVEEPPAEAVAAAILTPDAPELPAESDLSAYLEQTVDGRPSLDSDELPAGPSPELPAEVAAEDKVCDCGHVADDHTKQGDCMRGGCECVDSPTRPSAVSLGFFDDPDEDEDDDEPLIPAMRMDELEQICQDAREAAVPSASPAAISDERIAEILTDLNDNLDKRTVEETDGFIRELPEFVGITRRECGDIMEFSLRGGIVIAYNGDWMFEQVAR